METNVDLNVDLRLDGAVLKTYLSRRVEDLQILTESLSAGSVEKFNHIGHRILGSARTFGFPDLEILAQKMNAMSTSELGEMGPQILREFSLWLERTKADPRLETTNS